MQCGQGMFLFGIIFGKIKIEKKEKMASLYIFTKLPLPEEYHQLIAAAKCSSYRSKMSDPPPLPNTDLHVFNEPETDFFFSKAIPIMSMQKTNCIVCGTSKHIKEFATLVAGAK